LSVPLLPSAGLKFEVAHSSVVFSIRGMSLARGDNFRTGDCKQPMSGKRGIEDNRASLVGNRLRYPR